MFDCASTALAGTGALTAAFIASLSDFLTRKKGAHRAGKGDLQVLDKPSSSVESSSIEDSVRERFTEFSKLGEGISGEVWKVKCATTGHTRALKCMRKRASGVNDQGSLAREVACLKSLRHPHIVNFVEAIETDAAFCIVMECCGRGATLYDRMLQIGNFSEDCAAHIIHQVLSAVQYMHLMGVVHRDLKLENVLLVDGSPDVDVKIADFGHAVVLGPEERDVEPSRMKKSPSVSGGFMGTSYYMAPEVLHHGACYSPQCDVWSTGCLAHELICGELPFVAADAEEIYRLVRASSGPTFASEVWQSVSKEGREIVAAMLQHAPEERPSAKEALGYDWFKLMCHRPDEWQRGGHLRISSATSTGRDLSSSSSSSPSLSPRSHRQWAAQSSSDDEEEAAQPGELARW